MKRALILAMLAIWPAKGWGWRVIGTGAVSCGTWTSDRRTPNGTLAFMDGQWVLGFLSGQAELSATAGGTLDPLKDMDAQGVWAWVDNYCQANPLKQIWEAADAFSTAHPH